MVHVMNMDTPARETHRAIGVEWGMQIQLRFRSFPESHRSILVGMNRGQYLICSMPRIPGIWVALQRHDEVTVRYLQRGVVYGFKSVLLNMIDEPFRLLFLSYPEDIETVNLRRCERIRCLVPATARKDDATYSGVLLDVSLTGCCFAFDPPSDGSEAEIGAGEEIGVSFQLSGLRENRLLDVDVVSVRKQGGKIVLGGSFKNLKDDMLAAVKTHLETVEGFADIEHA
jgi:c-di-GMP-binding flagellar brake protein YcgR